MMRTQILTWIAQIVEYSRVASWNSPEEARYWPRSTMLWLPYRKQSLAVSRSGVLVDAVLHAEDELILVVEVKVGQCCISLWYMYP